MQPNGSRSSTAIVVTDLAPEDDIDQRTAVRRRDHRPEHERDVGSLADGLRRFRRRPRRRRLPRSRRGRPRRRGTASAAASARSSRRTTPRVRPAEVAGHLIELGLRDRPGTGVATSSQAGAAAFRDRIAAGPASSPSAARASRSPCGGRLPSPVAPRARRTRRACAAVLQGYGPARHGRRPRPRRLRDRGGGGVGRDQRRPHPPDRPGRRAGQRLARRLRWRMPWATGRPSSPASPTRTSTSSAPAASAPLRSGCSRSATASTPTSPAPSPRGMPSLLVLTGVSWLAEAVRGGPRGGGDLPRARPAGAPRGARRTGPAGADGVWSCGGAAGRLADDRDVGDGCGVGDRRAGADRPTARGRARWPATRSEATDAVRIVARRSGRLTWAHQPSPSERRRRSCHGF